MIQFSNFIRHKILFYNRLNKHKIFRVPFILHNNANWRYKLGPKNAKKRHQTWIQLNEVVCKGAKIRNSCLTVILRNGNSKKSLKVLGKYYLENVVCWLHPNPHTHQKIWAYTVCACLG